MAEAQADSAPAVAVALPDWQVLTVDGPDAARFLHAQLACDVSALACSHWRWGCWLNAQGRVIALFLLLRTADAAFRLLLPHQRADDIRQGLSRYVLRAKLALALDPAARVVGATGATPTPSPRTGGALCEDGAVRWCPIGGRLGRHIGLACAAASVEAPPAGEDWSLADVDDGIPWLAAVVSEQWIPQALALERLAAYSLRKGCYPGQEIVARTHYLGRSKRVLRVLEGPAPAPRPGARLRAAEGDEPVGEIVHAALAAAGAARALAVLREDAGTVLWPEGATAPWRAGPAWQSRAD